MDANRTTIAGLVISIAIGYCIPTPISINMALPAQKKPNRTQ